VTPSISHLHLNSVTESFLNRDLRELADTQVVEHMPGTSQFREANVAWKAKMIGGTAAVAVADVREPNPAQTLIPELHSKVARERELIERVLAGETELL